MCYVNNVVLRSNTNTVPGAYFLSNSYVNRQKIYGRRQQKVPIYRPYNGTGNTVQFPFRSRLISVRLPFLSVFKPFPFCPKGSPSVLVNGPDCEIKCACSLIAQEGPLQFGDGDRARARAT